MSSLYRVDEAGRVHRLGDRQGRRGSSPEVRARAFDKPGTDRSTLPSTSGKGKYEVIEASNEGDYILVHVMKDNIDSSKYHGINVLFMRNGRVAHSVGDRLSDEQWKTDEAIIVATARKHVGAEKIAAFVKAGGTPEKRKPDDWDNGENQVRDEDRIHKHVKEGRTTFKEFILREATAGWYVMQNGKSVSGPFTMKDAADTVATNKGGDAEGYTVEYVDADAAGTGATKPVPSGSSQPTASMPVPEGMNDREWIKDKADWKKAVAKLDVEDDGPGWAKYEGKLVAKWYDDREEGWIDRSHMKNKD